MIRLAQSKVKIPNTCDNKPFNREDSVRFAGGGIGSFSARKTPGEEFEYEALYPFPISYYYCFLSIMKKIISLRIAQKSTEMRKLFVGSMVKLV